MSLDIAPGDPAALLASPCVGVCQLDPATGWCRGCARDDLELASWRDLDPEQRAQIWRDLPRRSAALGLGFNLLPWTGAALLERLAAWSGLPRFCWSMGAYGAVAELAAPAGGSLAVDLQGEQLEVRAEGGAMRLAAVPGLRAFALGDGKGPVSRIVLALHRARLRAAPAHAVTSLGADAEAIDPGRRGQMLVDLGLGFANCRFCVRSDDRGLLNAMADQAGQPLARSRPPLVPHLLAASPTRVLVSPVGRIEIDTPILGRRPDGPRTHLLPDLLARQLEIEPGLPLPDAYAPCASLHPPPLA